MENNSERFTNDPKPTKDNSRAIDLSKLKYPGMAFFEYTRSQKNK